MDRNKNLSVFAVIGIGVAVTAGVIAIWRSQLRKKSKLKQNDAKMSTAQLQNGQTTADRLLEEIRQEISEKFGANPQNRPGLAIVQVGDREDSNAYVQKLLRAAEKCGIRTRHVEFKQDTTTKILLDELDQLNLDDRINGIVLEMPQQSSNDIDVELCLSNIDPDKEVDKSTTINADRSSNGEADNCNLRDYFQLVETVGAETMALVTIMRNTADQAAAARPQSALVRVESGEEAADSEDEISNLQETKPQATDLPRLEDPMVTTGLKDFQVKKCNEFPDDFNLDDYYANSSNPKGLVMIINNRKFESKTQEERAGSENDVANFTSVFEQIGYRVEEPLTNLTADAMRKAIAEFSQRKEHEKYDSAVVIVMTHGKAGKLYGVDGKEVDTDLFIRQMNGYKCPQLLNKPKFFIFQACRGSLRDYGVSATTSESGSIKLSKTEEDRIARIVKKDADSFHNTPQDADIITAYSTSNDFVSLKTDKGTSWFGDALCRTLADKSNILRLLDICQEANRENARRSGREKEGGPLLYQASTISFSLLKRFLLMPGFFGKFVMAFCHLLTKELWATHFERKIKNFLLDCDGVLWRGDNVIPGAPDAVAHLKKMGMRVILVTNDSGRSRASYLKKCTSLGFKDISEEDIVTSSTVLADYMKHSIKFPESKRVYVIGSQEIANELDSIGISSFGVGPDNMNADTVEVLVNKPLTLPAQQVGAVVVGFDNQISFPKVLKAATYLQDQQCLFIATNDDESFPTANPNIVCPGAGSNVAIVEIVAGRKPVTLGKPYQPMFKYITKHYGLKADETVMVGCRLRTDTQFARANGMTSLFVLTGVDSLETVAIAKEKTSKIDSRFFLQSIDRLDFYELIDWYLMQGDLCSELGGDKWIAIYQLMMISYVIDYLA